MAAVQKIPAATAVPKTVVRSSALKYMGSINNTNPLTSSVNEILVYNASMHFKLSRYSFRYASRMHSNVEVLEANSSRPCASNLFSLAPKSFRRFCAAERGRPAWL